MVSKVSLADIATASGVSLATVDRVINQRGGVHSDKEARVIAAARMLGWERSLDRPPTRTARVVVMIQPPSNPFHAALADGIEAARGSFGALGLQVRIRHIDPNDPSATAAAISALSGQCEGLVISSPSTPEVTAALAAFSANAPLVTLATDIDGSGRAAYVGPDDERSGRVAADLMGRFLGPDGGEIVMLTGRTDMAGQAARARGFTDLLARHHPQCHLADIIETGEAADAVARQVHAAFAAHPAIRGIYHASVGAMGLVTTLHRVGRDDVVIISHELTPNRRRLLAARRLDAVIDQKPHEEARLALDTMARLLGRMDGEGLSISTDIQIHMPENV
jgi:LacI family transcriptional regulator